MENLTDQIISLENGKKYYVFRQALYKGVTYYLAIETTEDEEDFTDNIAFLERIEEDDKSYLQKVTDQKVIQTLAKNIKIEE